MKISNKNIVILMCLFNLLSCNSQPDLEQSGKTNTGIIKSKYKEQREEHFECHSSEYRFNTLPPLPEPLPYVDFEPIYIQQQRESPFGNAAKRLTIPMNEALIISKLQDLGFIEYSNNEIYEKNFRKKGMYSDREDDGIYLISIILKDIIKPGCPYNINVYYINNKVNSNKVNGVEVRIGDDGLILRDTAIPDLLISTINHKHKPENLFKDLLDKHIQNIEAFKQKQPLNEELISTRAIYDGITYEISSFGGGRETMLQIYRYKDSKKSH